MGYLSHIRRGIRRLRLEIVEDLAYALELSRPSPASILHLIPLITALIPTGMELDIAMYLRRRINSRARREFILAFRDLEDRQHGSECERDA